MAFTRKAAIGLLRRAHNQKRLGHAYLISGPAGSGKREVAAELASTVNGTDAGDVFSSKAREIFVAEPESKSRRILIEQIRELEHGLQMRASDGRRKVAIIAEADRLQPQAANAFLKTLEEPPNDSLLLVLSSMPEILPDTILSRCIALPLAAEEKAELGAEEQELVELLGSVATPAAKGVQHPYRLARGFHRLLAQMREAIQQENAAALKRDEMRYKNTTDGAWLSGREDYFKALTESQYVRQRSRLVEILFLWWSDVLRANTGVARCELPAASDQILLLGEKLSTSEILRRFRRLEEMRDHLGRNIQEALAI